MSSPTHRLLLAEDDVEIRQALDRILGSRNGTALETARGEWQQIMPGIGVSVRDGERIRLVSRTVTIYHLQH